MQCESSTSRVLLVLLVLASSWPTSHAYTRVLGKDGPPLVCDGMYSSADVSGPHPPSIRLSLAAYAAKADTEAPALTLSVLVYNLLAEEHVGLLAGDDALPVCDVRAVNASRCPAQDLGAFILEAREREVLLQPPALLNAGFAFGKPPSAPISPPGKGNSSSNATTPSIPNAPLGRVGATSADFPIPTTAFYCVYVQAARSTDAGALEPLDALPYPVDVRFANPYGLLPAPEYPKLVFFGVLTLVYLALGLAWLALAYRVWNSLLTLQHYVSGVLAFLAVEMAVQFGHYDYTNANGQVSMVLLCLSVALNAARHSVSFFLLLIVALGYGVVKPTLGNMMKLCVGLSVLHFVFGLLYAYSAVFEQAFDPALLMLFVLPLSFTITLFYAWTMGALRNTMDHLRAKRQSIKLLMYERLQGILAVSGTLLLVYMLVTMSILQRMNQPDWIPTFWRVRWWLSDGVPHLLYLGTFVGVAALWRPTEYNERYSLDQLVDLELEEGQGDLEGELHELQAIPSSERNGHDDGEQALMRRPLRDHQGVADTSAVAGRGRDDAAEEHQVQGDEDDDDDDERAEGRGELDLEDPESVLRWMEESVGYNKSPDLGEAPPSYSWGPPRLP